MTVQCSSFSSSISNETKDLIWSGKGGIALKPVMLRKTKGAAIQFLSFWHLSKCCSAEQWGAGTLGLARGYQWAVARETAGGNRAAAKNSKKALSSPIYGLSPSPPTPVNNLLLLSSQLHVSASQTLSSPRDRNLFCSPRGCPPRAFCSVHRLWTPAASLTFPNPDLMASALFVQVVWDGGGKSVGSDDWIRGCSMFFAPNPPSHCALSAGPCKIWGETGSALVL